MLDASPTAKTSTNRTSKTALTKTISQMMPTTWERVWVTHALTTKAAVEECRSWGWLCSSSWLSVGRFSPLRASPSTASRLLTRWSMPRPWSRPAELQPAPNPALRRQARVLDLGLCACAAWRGRLASCAALL